MSLHWPKDLACNKTVTNLLCKKLLKKLSTVKKFPLGMIWTELYLRLSYSELMLLFASKWFHADNPCHQ